MLIPLVDTPIRSRATAALENWVSATIGPAVHLSRLILATPLVAIPNGWDSHTLTFQLTSVPTLPCEWREPLVLRAYGSMAALPQARREFAIQTRLWQIGFPVARPLLLSESASPWGGPAWFMERLQGPTLLAELNDHPWRLWDLPARMARQHVLLHELPVEDEGTDGDFLDRSLNRMAATVAGDDLPGLARGVSWLTKHRPVGYLPLRILHLDFHPMNLICRPDGALAVIDWADTEVGDPDADVAATCMLLECGPTEGISPWLRAVETVGRGIVLRRYLAAYRRLRPLKENHLAYYRAWAVLRRLCLYGRWLHRGVRATGSKPGALAHLTPAYLDNLCRYFRRWSGIAVELQ